MNALKKPTNEEIELGLIDADIKNRLHWATRTDYTPTFEQAERGIDRSSPMAVRMAFSEREDYKSETVERLLTHPKAWIRSTFAQFCKVNLTTKQIERGLMDVDWPTAIAFECRLREWEERKRKEEYERLVLQFQVNPQIKRKTL